MNVLQNMVELYNSLSLDSTYRVVIKGILENLNHMQNVTIYDVAEMTNSSRTTVWRAIQKMGYSNFTDFRHALQSAVQDYTYYNRMIPMEFCRESDQLLGNIKSSLMQSVELLESHLTPELIDELTDEIYKAEKVRFYLPFKLPYIYSFQQNLAMTGKETSYCTLLPDMIGDAQMLNSHTIVFISAIEFAETLNIKAAFEGIKAKEAKIWLVGASTSRYSRYAHRILLDERVEPTVGLYMYQNLFLMLSEYYRAKYIDEK